jgi:hypothetical protein
MSEQNKTDTLTQLKAAAFDLVRQHEMITLRLRQVSEQIAAIEREAAKPAPEQKAKVPEVKIIKRDKQHENTTKVSQPTDIK